MILHKKLLAFSLYSLGSLRKLSGFIDEGICIREETAKRGREAA